ncbi:MAG: MFS transporter [Candidatus Methylumidiphilus sp.]
MTAIETNAQTQVHRFMWLAGLNGVIVGLVGVLAPLFALSLNASTLQIGLVAGVLPLGIGLMSIPIGMAIDRFGPRRVFAVGSVLGFVGFVLVSKAQSPGWLIFATALSSPAVPMHFLSIQSEFFHYLNETGNAKAGWIRATQMGGVFAAGPVLGGIAVSFLDYRTLYWLVALSFVLLFLLARQTLSGYAEAQARRFEHHRLAFIEQIKLVFSHPEIIDTSVIALISSGASSFYNAFIIVISIEQFHYSKQAGVALLMGQGISYIGALFLLGGLIDRWGRAFYYKTSYALAVFGLLLLGSAEGLWGLWLGAVAQGLGQGMVAVANVVRQATVSRELGRGNVAGAGNPPAAFGAVAGALVGGLLGDWIGLQNVFFVMIATYALLVWLALSRESQDHFKATLAQAFGFVVGASKQFLVKAYTLIE